MVDLTIIIPAYNVGYSIEKTLDSIFSQNTKYAFEVICVAGPSTDDTRDIIARVQKEHSNLVMIKYEERNSLGARDLGIKAAQGRYITFCDGDDRQSSDAIDTVVSKMDETGADMINTGFYFEKKRRTRPTIFRKNATLNNEQLYKALLRDTFIRGYLWSKVFKADILKSINFHFPGKNIYRDDTYFNFLIARYIKKAVLIRHPVYYYNKREASTFSGASQERMNAFIKVLGFQRFMIEKSHNPKLLSFYCGIRIRRWGQVYFDLLLNKKAYNKQEYKQFKKDMRKYLKVLSSKKEFPIEGMPWEELIKPYQDEIK